MLFDVCPMFAVTAFVSCRAPARRLSPCLQPRPSAQYLVPAHIADGQLTAGSAAAPVQGQPGEGCSCVTKRETWDETCLGSMGCDATWSVRRHVTNDARCRKRPNADVRYAMHLPLCLPAPGLRSMRVPIGSRRVPPRSVRPSDACVVVVRQALCFEEDTPPL